MCFTITLEAGGLGFGATLYRRRKVRSSLPHGHVAWDSKSTLTVTLSRDLEHISRKSCNNSLKFFFSHKMASATKRFRNAVSFKPNRFMPLSQTTCRKQCLLYFELRGCIVSKKRRVLKARDMLTLAFSFAINPYLNLGALFWMLYAFTCGLLHEKFSSLFTKPGFLESRIDKAHFRRRNSFDKICFRRRSF